MLLKRVLGLAQPMRCGPCRLFSRRKILVFDVVVPILNVPTLKGIKKQNFRLWDDRDLAGLLKSIGAVGLAPEGGGDTVRSLKLLSPKKDYILKMKPGHWFRDISKLHDYTVSHGTAFGEQASWGLVALLQRLGEEDVARRTGFVPFMENGRDKGHIDGFVVTKQRAYVITAKPHAEIKDVQAAVDAKYWINNKTNAVRVSTTHSDIQSVLATAHYSEELRQCAAAANVFLIHFEDGLFRLVK